MRNIIINPDNRFYNKFMKMYKNRIITFFAFAAVTILMASCAVTSHPNEQILVGTWKPVKVEKIVDSSAFQAYGSKPSGTNQTKSRNGKVSGTGDAGRLTASLDKQVQVEMHSTLQIFANKTAIKKYGAKIIHATWKLKGNGTRIVAKNVENKMRFVIEILEINKEHVVVIEHASAADIKITYERVE